MGVAGRLLHCAAACVLRQAGSSQRECVVGLFPAVRHPGSGKQDRGMRPGVQDCTWLRHGHVLVHLNVGEAVVYFILVKAGQADCSLTAWRHPEALVQFSNVTAKGAAVLLWCTQRCVETADKRGGSGRAGSLVMQQT